ncbi:TIGR03749 family integrating conjugative element protein [Salmonella enterica]|nr:TIGR03749 family integrating conjugative element protein [Salmonella enterica]EMD7797612.1 TIGR03749 family integrating conjugative element protein [Salmonella enterica]
MKIPVFRFFSLLMMLLFCNTPLHATELMQWQRLPLQVELHTGHERVIFVNRNVRVGYPAELDGRLRIQSSGGTVYLLAAENFPDTRLQLSDMDSGELILLDVRAVAGEALEPVELRYDDAVWRNNADMAEDAAPSQAVMPEAHTGPLPVVLTRYAAQMLYAPLRTVEPAAGIAPVPVRLPPVITTLLPTELITASPLAAWRLSDTTVTAVKLQNRSQQRISLDPRALQGQFLTATFQHDWLGADGTPEDTTVVYLVTDGSADRAVLPEPPAADAKKRGGK